MKRKQYIFTHILNIYYHIKNEIIHNKIQWGKKINQRK